MMTWTSILQNNFSDKLLLWIDSFVTDQLEIITNQPQSSFYHDQLLKILHQVINVHPHKTYRLLRSSISRFLKSNYSFIEVPIIKRICDIAKVNINNLSPGKVSPKREIKMEPSTPSSRASTPKKLEFNDDESVDSVQLGHMTLLDRRRFEIKQRLAQRKKVEKNKKHQQVVEEKRKAKLRAKFRRKYHSVDRKPLYQSPTKQKSIATPSSRSSSRSQLSSKRSNSRKSSKRVSQHGKRPQKLSTPFASPKRGFYKQYKPDERLLVKYCRDLVVNMMKDVLYGEAEERFAQQSKLKKRRKSVRKIYEKVKQSDDSTTPKRDYMQAAKAHKQKIEEEERAKEQRQREESRERARQLAKRNKLLKEKIKAHKQRKKSKEEAQKLQIAEKEKERKRMEKEEMERKKKEHELKKQKIKEFKEAQKKQLALEKEKQLEIEQAQKEAEAAQAKYRKEQKELLKQHHAIQTQAALVLQRFARMKLAQQRCTKKKNRIANSKKIKIPKYKTIKPIEIIVFSNGNRYDTGTTIRVNPKTIRNLTELFLHVSKHITTTGPLSKIFSPEGFLLHDIHHLRDHGKYVVGGGEGFNYEKCPEVLIDELVEQETKEHREKLRKELRSPPSSRSSHRPLVTSPTKE